MYTINLIFIPGHLGLSVRFFGRIDRILVHLALGHTTKPTTGYISLKLGYSFEKKDYRNYSVNWLFQEFYEQQIINNA